MYLSWVDYALFFAMLVMSAAIGIYYGLLKKQSSAKEYFLGGKTMKVWPVSLSLVSGCISGNPLLVFPTQVHLYGISIALITLLFPLMTGVAYFVYLPVFYKLQVTSKYEYLQLRFGKELRIFGSAVYAIYTTMSLSLVIYVPSLVMAEVTGISIHILTPTLFSVCILYTTLGGFRAVVWTDVLQFIFMMGTMLVIVTVGTIHIGGIENAWRLASENERLHINFAFDPTLKDSFWSGTVGYLFVYLFIISLNQGNIQKCMSLSNYKYMKKTTIFSTIGLMLLHSFIFFTGLTIYSKYYDCDPFTSKQIRKLTFLTTRTMYLSWVDYALFFVMLVMSAAIGIYYGLLKKQSSAKEYFLGGKTMKVWPVSLSLVSGCMSGNPLLLFPTQVYLYGISIALITLLFPLMMGVAYFVYLPVFYKLQVTSKYEYLQLRFGKELRIFGSVVYTIYMTLILSLVVYVPSLVMAEATGISIHILTPTLFCICILYTTLGGFRAVVWTDVLQFIFMMGAMLVIVTVGTIHVGGIENVWRLASENERLHINFAFDLTLKDSFWNGPVGYFFIYIFMISLNQGSIQKCMSLSNYEDMKKTMIFSTVGLILLHFFIFFTGLTIYSKYYDCDPFTSKQIRKIDQLLPFFVMDISKNIPGVVGLFISGILSAALSTLSAGMNSLAATVYEDFVKPFLKEDFSEKYTGYLLKFLVVLIGVICTAFIYLIDQMTSTFPAMIIVPSITEAPMASIFTVGMMIPMVNSIGALTGGIFSISFLSWIAIGAHFYRKEHPYPLLPVSTAGCAENHTVFDVINGTHSMVPNSDGFVLYKISDNYYASIAFLLVVVVSTVVSFLTKSRSKPVPKDCIAPFMQFLLPKTETCISREEGMVLTDEAKFKEEILH